MIMVTLPKICGGEKRYTFVECSDLMYLLFFQIQGFGEKYWYIENEKLSHLDQNLTTYRCNVFFIIYKSAPIVIDLLKNPITVYHTSIENADLHLCILHFLVK